MSSLLFFVLAACTAPAPPSAASPQACALPPPSASAPAVAPERTARCAAESGLGLTYEIYVRSFQDSDADGIGDLAGVAMRLDHLEALGVETLWLMPLFPAVGPAGYDVTDFDRVRAEYGDETDLADLVADARARGMRVLLDLPFNHVARTHPWFAAAEPSPDAAERNRFVFSDTRWDPHRWFPASGGGYYYGFFGSELPDLDWTDAVAQERMFDVFARWAALADGYRLDAVLPLVESDGAITDTDDTHALLGELYAHVRAENPAAALLAEASADGEAGQAAYLGGAEAPESDRVLDFARRDALLAAIDGGGPDPLLAHLAAQVAAGSLGRTAAFLQSHDLSRLPAYVPDAGARRLLQVLKLTLPGDPVLYYGEELDLADATTATGQDYAWRAPMPWDGTRNGGFTDAPVAWMTPDPGYLAGANVAAAAADPASAMNLIRAIGCVREEIAGGEWEPVATDGPEVLAYQWWTEEGRVIVVANLGARAAGEVRVDARGGFRSLTEDVGVDAREGLRIAALPAHGYAIYGDGVAGDCAIPAPLVP